MEQIFARLRTFRLFDKRFNPKEKKDLTNYLTIVFALLNDEDVFEPYYDLGKAFIGIVSICSSHAWLGLAALSTTAPHPRLHLIASPIPESVCLTTPTLNAQ